MVADQEWQSLPCRLLFMLGPAMDHDIVVDRSGTAVRLQSAGLLDNATASLLTTRLRAAPCMDAREL